jgi:O-antigen/teichoic acid export membrane protein
MKTELSATMSEIEHASTHLPSDEALVRIAKGSVFLFFGTFFGLGLNYLYAVMLGRIFGPRQFGLYALGLGVFSFLSVIAMAGLDSAVLRFIPAFRAQNDNVRIRRTVSAALVLALCLGGLFATALWLGSQTIAELFHHAEVAHVLKFFAVCIPLFVVSNVALAVLQGFREVPWRTSVKYLCEPVAKFLVTMGLLDAGWGLISALIAMPAALLLTTALSLLPLRRLSSGSNGSVSSASGYGDILGYSMPLLGGLVFAGLATRSDVFLLGYWTSVEEIGIYSAAFQTSTIMAVVLGTLDSIATPFLSESIARKERAQLHLLAGTVLRWTLMATIPLFLIMTVFAKELMALFGSDFESGWVSLTILAFGQFVNSAMGCSNSMLLWAGYSKLVMWNSFVASAVQIGLYFVLIPLYGPIGAALATSAGLILVVMMRVVQVRRLLNVWPYEWATFKPLLAGLTALLLVLTIQSVMAITHVAILAAQLVGFYLPLLLGLGLEESDRAILLQLKQRFLQPR